MDKRARLNGHLMPYVKKEVARQITKRRKAVALNEKKKRNRVKGKKARAARRLNRKRAA